MDRCPLSAGMSIAHLARRYQRPSRPGRICVRKAFRSSTGRATALRRVGLRHPDLVHSGGRGAVFDAVHPSFVNRPCRTTITVWSTRAGRFVSLLADRALHFVPADLIVRWLGDQPPVSETATVIPARGATGLSMAIIAAPAFSSGMRSAISSRRSSRPSVIIASMAG